MEMNVRVFVDGAGKFGAMHRVIFDEKQEINPDIRLKIAKELGLDETIFVNDVKLGDISIFSQTNEVRFAGSAALATAYALREYRHKVPSNLKCQGNVIPVVEAQSMLWITGDMSTFPEWNIVSLDSVSELLRLEPSYKKSLQHTLLWSWQDQDNGIVRARTFATDWLIPEVEANGSGCMILAKTLNRNITAMHGQGSVIYAGPVLNDAIFLGGKAIVESKAPDFASKV